MDQKNKDKLADILWYLKGQIDLSKSNFDTTLPFDQSHINALNKAMNQEPRQIIIDRSVAEKYWIESVIVDFDYLDQLTTKGGSVYLVGEGKVNSAAFVANYQYRRLKRMLETNQIIEVKKK